MNFRALFVRHSGAGCCRLGDRAISSVKAGRNAPGFYRFEHRSQARHGKAWQGMDYGVASGWRMNDELDRVVIVCDGWP